MVFGILRGRADARLSGSARLKLLGGASLATLAIMTRAYAADPIPVPGVSVEGTGLTTDQQIQQDGTEVNGYRSDEISRVGQLGDRSVLDTPYTFSVVPQALIENVQPSSGEQLFEMAPSVRVTLPESQGLGIRLSSRGFALDQSEDGFRYSPYNNNQINIEDKERIEILSGLSGFLYGQTNPGGLVNYVLKRPTDTPLANITVGEYDGGSFYVHGDFGGPIDQAGKFGYRLNLVGQDGGTSVDDQNVKRYLVSGAFDWHITDTLLFQLDGSWSDYRIDGQTVVWGFNTYAFSPPDASKDWGEPFAYDMDRRGDFGGKLNWNPTDNASVRAGYKYIMNRDDSLFIQNQPTSPTGTYNQFANNSDNFKVFTQDTYLFADYKFVTGSVKHTMTAGISGDSFSGESPIDGSDIFTTTGFTLNDPAANAIASNNVLTRYRTSVIDTLPSVTFGRYWEVSRQIGDDIRIGDSWELLGGINYGTIGVTNYNFATGVQTSAYRANALSPSASLIYKIDPDISVYSTYIQGLENGGTATATHSGLPVTNPGSLPPTVDWEYEGGVKAKLGGALATFAVYDITKASAFYILNPGGTSYTFDGAGRQRNWGVDVSLTGKLTDDLTFYGGVNAFDAKITENANPVFIGQEPAGGSPVMAKAYAEYAVRAVPGLVLDFGTQWYSRQRLTTGNTAHMPSYTVLDAGVRYSTPIYGKDTTFRLNVYNLTDSNYWATGGGSTVEGAPLTVQASVQVHLW